MSCTTDTLLHPLISIPRETLDIHSSIHPSFVHLSIHLFIHSSCFIHPFIHPFVHSFIHSSCFIHSFIHPFILFYPSIYSSIHPVLSIHSFIYPFFIRSIYPFVPPLIYSPINYCCSFILYFLYFYNYINIPYFISTVCKCV